MKFQASQSAPDFTVTAINGSTVQLSAFKGKKVFLTFYRNVGCPVCNLRFHELLPLEREFQAKYEWWSLYFSIICNACGSRGTFSALSVF